MYNDLRRMKKVKIKVFLSIVIATMLILTGCSTSSSTSNSNQLSQKPSDQKFTPFSLETSPGTKIKGADDGLKANKNYTIGVLIPNLPDPFYVAEYYGIKTEADKLGVKVIMYDSGGYANVEKQISQMQDLMQQKVDAIMIAATSGPGTKKIVDTAVDQGIPVMTFTSYTQSDKVFSRVANPLAEMGELEGKYLANALHGEGKVLALAGPPGGAVSLARYAGFEKFIKQNTHIQLVNTLWSESSRVEGLNKMQDALQSIPDLKGVYTFSDLIGDGVADAVVASKKKGIDITTCVLSKGTVKYIKDGVISMTVDGEPVLTAKMAFDVTIAHLNGEEVPKDVDAQLRVVTKENIDSVDLSTSQAPANFKP